MINLDATDWALVCVVMVSGAACQAAIGMGLNLIAIPLLILINPIYSAGPVMVASCLLSVLALWRVPAVVDAGDMGWALGGLVLGTALAAVVVALMDTAELVRVLGGCVVVGVGLALSGVSLALKRRNLVLAGGGAGLLGTIAGVHGPPIALLYQGMRPDRMRGALLTFIATGNGLAVATLALVGRFGMAEVMLTLTLIPGMVAGLLIAPALARWIAARTLRLLVLGVSAVSGVLLMVR